MKVDLENGVIITVDSKKEDQIMDILVRKSETTRVVTKKLGRPAGSTKKRYFPNGRHTWTVDERGKLFTLHSQNMSQGMTIDRSVKNIRKEFGVSDKAVYSQLRKLKKHPEFFSINR